MTVWWIQFIEYINKWLPIFLTGYSTMRPTRIGVFPPTKVACLKASENLEHPIISEPTNTTSFGRHKALDWWVALYILESNPRTWGEHNIFINFWRFGGISGSQPSNFSFTNQIPKAANLPMNLPKPWRVVHDGNSLPRHWEVALKAGPFTEVQFGKLNKS